MLVLRVKSGGEIMVTHRSGETCFLRVSNLSRRYGQPPQIKIEEIQEGDTYELTEVPPGDDLARYVLTHNMSQEIVRVCVGGPNMFSGVTATGINVALDDKAHNFKFFRPEVWKRKYLKMMCGTAE